MNMLTPGSSPITGNKLAECRECGFTGHWLGEHVVSSHGMSITEYTTKWPDASVSSQDADARRACPAPQRVDQVRRTLGGVEFLVNLNVPLEDCLPLPEAYRFPQHGLLAEQVEDAMLALRDRAHTWIYGRGGGGKDGLGHALSALARWPAKKYAISQDADIQSWFFSRAFNATTTYWEEGPLLKQLRDGYQPPDGGPRMPYMILISDGDRAAPKQAEHFRMILDSIEGRVPGPEGVTYEMFPGTVFLITANTNGTGDPSGRFVSARPQDSTMMERLMVMVEFPWMEWEDEEPIVRDKFPLFVRECERVELTVNGRARTVNMLEEVGKVVRKLRQEIYSRKINTDFSHRHLCYWLKHAERRIQHQEGVSVDLLSRSAKVWLSRIGDERTRMSVIKIMDAEITGSMLGGGRK